MKATPITATIHFAQDVVHHRHLQLPYMIDDSAEESVIAGFYAAVIMKAASGEKPAIMS